ncbi:MAG: DnaD domain protein [Bacilli bacterium]|nr:DnaD domain protein [Bacilli bacterium]
MADELRTTPLLSKGYGIIPKLVMQDDRLSIEAKGIYSYLSSFTGNGNVAYPGIERICHDLKISENRFHKNKKELIDCGYIEVARHRKEKGFSNNVYTLSQAVTLQFEGIGIVGIGIEGTNNNSLKKEVVVADKPKQKRYFQTVWQESGMGMINGLLQQKLQCWVDDFNGEEEIINYAIELTAEQGGNSYKYVEAILKNWIGKCKTVEDAKALTLEFEKKKAARGGGYGKANKPTAKPILKAEEMEQNERYARYLAANGLGADNNKQSTV